MSVLLLCALMRRARIPLRAPMTPLHIDGASWRKGIGLVNLLAQFHAASTVVEPYVAHAYRAGACTIAEIVLAACRTLSLPFALVHAAWVIGLRKRLAPCLVHCRANLLATLIDLWATRFLREATAFLLRTPLRRGVLELIDDAPLASLPEGCVIAVCHSPWFRWLSEWCKDRGGIRVVAGADWVVRARGVNVLGGYGNVHALVTHLKEGGRVVVIGDVFGALNGCALQFLGVPRHASLLPARLAALAGVPLVGLVPECHAHYLCLTPGPRFLVNRTNQDAVMRGLLAYYESEIRHRPARWGRIGKRADEG